MDNLPPTSRREMSHSTQYFIGSGIGLAQLILFLAGWELIAVAWPLYAVALVLYLLELIAAIVCLCITRVRFVGYGLLTMFFVSPVIAAIACNVLPSPTVF